MIKNGTAKTNGKNFVRYVSKAHYDTQAEPATITVYLPANC